MTDIDEKIDDNIHIKGFIYVMFNEVFNHYGPNVYKIGKAQNIQSRMKAYTTSYIKPIEVIFSSSIVSDYSIAEKEIHNRLNKFRLASNREFFSIELELITKTINDVINDVNSKSNEELVKYEFTKIKYVKKLNVINLVENYKMLIDIDAQHNNEQNETEGSLQNQDVIKQAQIVSELLKSLGYANMLDTRQIIDMDFDAKIEELKIGLFLTEQTDIKRLFGMTKLQPKLDTRKAALGFINILLKNFNIQISSTRKHLTDGYKYFFVIEHNIHQL